MPTFTVPLHEANDCHTPAGSPQGGQFCSKGGGSEVIDGPPPRVTKGDTITDASTTLGPVLKVVYKITKSHIHVQAKAAYDRGEDPKISGFSSIPHKMFWRGVKKGFYKLP